VAIAISKTVQAAASAEFVLRSNTMKVVCTS